MISKYYLYFILGFALCACGTNCADKTSSNKYIHSILVRVDTSIKRIQIEYILAEKPDNSQSIHVSLYDSNRGKYDLSVFQLSGNFGRSIVMGKNKIIINYSGSNLIFKTLFAVIVLNNERNINMESVLNKVDTISILKNLKDIYGVRQHKSNPGHLAQVRNDIGKYFLDQEINVSKQFFKYDNYEACNIVGEIPGEPLNSNYFIVGAHFDTVYDSPGADDNGSGIAVLMELSKILSKYHFVHPIVILALDGEEDGMLGSQTFVSRAKEIDSNYNPVFINLDMLGYSSNVPKSQSFPSAYKRFFPKAYQEVLADDFRGDFSLCVFNKNSEDVGVDFAKYARNYVPNLKILNLEVPDNGEMLPDLRRSDHVSFWDNNFKALFIGDASYSRNPNYHTAGDSLGSVNIAVLSNITKAIISYLFEEAKVKNYIAYKVLKISLN